ncbi:MAG TPA: TetR family transcriptional regulator [Pseudonocardiaceae bacterium]|nr:TetR family transcriptional regulator [Pseudonocardiaceae bacterium]
MPTNQAEDKPLRADARRNRARVLEVAHEMFLAEGMAVPIDAIAERAGVGVGTVYRHFPTKEALFEAIMKHRIEALIEKARSLADAADPGAAFFEYFEYLVSQTEGSKGMHEALTSSGFKFQERIGDLSTHMLESMGVLLKRAQEAGAVRQGLTAVDAKALMAGITEMRGMGGDRDVTLAVVLAGMRPQL